MAELKKCPFCGSNMVFVQNTIDDKVTMGVHFDEPVALVLCGHCAAAAGFFKIKGDVTKEEAEAKAIEYWNMRADDEEDYSEVLLLLNTIPYADVQPVVRCKDCKHRDAEDGLCKGRGWPMQLVPDDGFCDKGERSEE